MEIMKEAKKEGYTKVYVDGGSTIQSFLKNECVGELILTRVPLILGNGIPLFASTNNQPLAHIKTMTYSNGLVQSTYRVPPTIV